jgi:hypothetical protein
MASSYSGIITDVKVLTKKDDVTLDPKAFLPFEPQIVEADPTEDKPEGSDAA